MINTVSNFAIAQFLSWIVGFAAMQCTSEPEACPPCFLYRTHGIGSCGDLHRSFLYLSFVRMEK